MLCHGRKKKARENLINLIVQFYMIKGSELYEYFNNPGTVPCSRLERSEVCLLKLAYLELQLGNDGEAVLGELLPRE